MKKALVYCSHGLGDGLLFLIISNNLAKNGYVVDTYHPFLHQIENWINYTKIKPYPKKAEDLNFDDYDLLVINSDYNQLNKEVLSFAKQNYVQKTFELHPSTCKGKNPPKGDLKFDFTKTIIDNLAIFCENNLNLKNPRFSNDLIIPKNLKYRKYSKRVAIHPSSKDIEKNWPKEKFQKLSMKLKKQGYDPYFILTSFEKEQFEDIKNIEKPSFKNLSEVASFIYESGYMVGNDSGLAHLSSSLKIPTLTIFSTKRKQRFWRPSFYLNKTVVSWPLINIKGLRLREKYWKKTITYRRVLKKFTKLIEENKNYESSRF